MSSFFAFAVAVIRKASLSSTLELPLCVNVLLGFSLEGSGREFATEDGRKFDSRGKRGTLDGMDWQRFGFLGGFRGFLSRGNGVFEFDLHVLTRFQVVVGLACSDAHWDYGVAGTKTGREFSLESSALVYIQGFFTAVGRGDGRSRRRYANGEVLTVVEAICVALSRIRILAQPAEKNARGRLLIFRFRIVFPLDVHGGNVLCGRREHPIDGSGALTYRGGGTEKGVASTARDGI